MCGGGGGFLTGLFGEQMPYVVRTTQAEAAQQPTRAVPVDSSATTYSGKQKARSLLSRGAVGDPSSSETSSGNAKPTLGA